MQTVLIYASSAVVRDRLEQMLQAASYTVECATQISDIAAILKHEARDVMISEVRKDNFAYLMRLAFLHNPATIIHFFEDKNVFCFYPMQKQPIKLVNAISDAGLHFSPRLLLHTQKTCDDSTSNPDTFEI
ncbi:MAG: hypothetical protein ACRC1J_07865 [Sandaracinobacteroides sp.]